MTSTAEELFRVKLLFVGEVADGLYEFVTQYTTGEASCEASWGNITCTRISSGIPPLNPDSRSCGSPSATDMRRDQVECEVAVWALHPSLLTYLAPSIVDNRFRTTDAVGLCFRVDDASSLANATDKVLLV